MKTYQIIKDESLLRTFIDRILPETEPDECFYVGLLARDKWIRDTGAKISSQIQLKRFTSTKDRLVEKIRQMECPFGAYRDRDKPIPEEALGLYITPNPRSYRRAGLALIREIATHIERETNFNPHQSALSCIQQTASRKLYFDLDIDLEGGETAEQAMALVRRALNEDCLHPVITRGGVHCLIELNKISKQFEKTWYNAIARQQELKTTFTMNGDNLLPVPGCVQGDFVPFCLTT